MWSASWVPIGGWLRAPVIGEGAAPPVTGGNQLQGIRAEIWSQPLPSQRALLLGLFLFRKPAPRPWELLAHSNLNLEGAAHCRAQPGSVVTKAEGGGWELDPLSRSSLPDARSQWCVFDRQKIKGEEMAHGTQCSWGWLPRYPLSSWLGLRASSGVSVGAPTGSLVSATLRSL